MTEYKIDWKDVFAGNAPMAVTKKTVLVKVAVLLIVARLRIPVLSLWAGGELYYALSKLAGRNN